ncbi:hypothetical protein R1flu_028974 [Riccia fluitans]|uniref:Uncharacterized protein n=1 Tax=Riccia fluitans TaxID=41844 RepID=A0ABD1XN88_9MARC
MASTLSLISSSGTTASTLTSSSVRSAIDSAFSSGACFTPFNGLKGKTTLSSQAYCEGHLVFSRSSSFRGCKQRRSAVVAMAAATETIPSLNDLPLIQYINQQGRIQPPVEKTTKATVFAIFDENKKIQFIGFSKDARNSLRTLMGRRPTLCYYYKLYNLDSLDQQKMLACRQQWVSELGLPPVGNGDPVQKNLWEQAADAGSISERGREAAATSMAKSFLQTMAERGLKEEMIYDPVLLAAGKCDVLPSIDQTEEEIAAAAKTQAEEAAKRHTVVVTSPDGDKIEFEIYFEFKFPTNGGWMYDILVSKDDKETRHRVICGRIYPEAVNIHEDKFVEIIMGFLLHKKIPRRTEGLMAGDAFPINYFAVSEVAQHFEDLKDWFTSELPETYWRFNRIHDYGGLDASYPELGPAAARTWSN